MSQVMSSIVRGCQSTLPTHLAREFGKLWSRIDRVVETNPPLAATFAFSHFCTAAAGYLNARKTDDPSTKIFMSVFAVSGAAITTLMSMTEVAISKKFSKSSLRNIAIVQSVVALAAYFIGDWVVSSQDGEKASLSERVIAGTAVVGGICGCNLILLEMMSGLGSLLAAKGGLIDAQDKAFNSSAQIQEIQPETIDFQSDDFEEVAASATRELLLGKEFEADIID